MIVVSDTSPLNYLALIGAIDVLPHLFEQIYVPPSVLAELMHLKTPDVVKAWASAAPSWVVVCSPKLRLAFTEPLDDGEADALSLAKELGIRDILIDERRGRIVAQREGLTPLPTLAVLERAAADGLLDLNDAIRRLQRTNIRVPPRLIEAALARDALRKQR